MKEIYEYDVYKLAIKLADKIWNDYDNWDIKTQHTIGYQIIRSADSISANLAEGFGRYSNPTKIDFIFFHVALLKKLNPGLEL